MRHQAISVDRPEYVNHIAEIGSGPGSCDPPLVVAAHYDTAEGTPGADANASGVSVLLELGRLLARAGPTALPVTLAALTLEEPPFFGTASQGAWRLASELRGSGARLRGAVVLESVGYFRPDAGSQAYPFPVGLLGYPGTGDFLGVVGNRRSRALIEETAGLRYGRVVIATDADVDGMHIRNLLLTYFLRYFEELVLKGHLYILETPLFRVRNKKQTRYCYSERERDEAIAEIGGKPEITRFKGLGEISPDEFGQFIGADMRLVPVSLGTLGEASASLEFCMGKNTPTRREFIVDNQIYDVT